MSVLRRSEVAGCPFCDICAGRARTCLLWEGLEAVAFAPLNPATKGHTLVVPKWHVDSVLGLDAVDTAVMGDAVRVVIERVMSRFAPDGLNVITSQGAAASQTVMHLHVHVLPRYFGDRVGDIWAGAR